MKFQLKVKLTKNGKTFAKGSIVTDKQIQRYGIKQDYLENVTRTTKKAKYTVDQENLLFDLYLENVDPTNNYDARDTIFAEFCKEYDTHDYASIVMFICGIKRIDRLYMAEGLAPKKSTVKKLNTIYPDRFISVDELDWTESFKD